MTGLAGLLLTSRTGARFIVKPIAQDLGVTRPRWQAWRIGGAGAAKSQLVPRFGTSLIALHDPALVVDGDQRRQRPGSRRCAADPG